MVIFRPKTTQTVLLYLKEIGALSSAHCDEDFVIKHEQCTAKSITVNHKGIFF